MRRKLFTLMTVIGLGCGYNYAQEAPVIEWEKFYGITSNANDDEAYDVLQTQDGGYLVAGRGINGTGTDSHGGREGWFLKLDVSGNLEWDRNYGGSANDEIFNIKSTSDGGYIGAGSARSVDGDVPGNQGLDDAWIIKLDASGNVLWSKTYGGSGADFAYSVQQTSDGGYVFAGLTQSSNGDITLNQGGRDYWVVKLDSTGEIQWQKTYGGSGQDYGYSIVQSPDNGYVVVGYSASSNGDISSPKGGNDIWVIKLDVSGNLIWEKSYGGTGSDIVFLGNAVTLADNGYVIATASASLDGDITAPKGTSGNDAWVFKIDESGTIQWEKSYGGTGADVAYGIKQAYGGYIVAGFTGSSDGDVTEFGGTIDIWVFKTDEAGTLLWQKTIGNDAIERSYGGIEPTADGGYIVVGTSTQGIQTDDYYIVKLGSECEIPTLTIENPGEVCFGGDVTITATSDYEDIYWYDTEDGSEPVFTGSEYTVENLTETVTFWVEAVNGACVSERTAVTITVNPLPELTVASIEVGTCFGTGISLYATSTTGNLIFWYDSPDATEWLATGNTYTTPDLTETTSYWVLAYNPETHCVSARTEVVVTVIPAPALSLETPEPVVCSGNEAELFATSEGNVIFWYENEEDEEYLYHGNLFITEELTETTTYWVEAYNILTGCASERIEVTVTVNPIPDAPIAVEVQYFEEGETLADLVVEVEGDLTWYADEFLTVVLPDTTPLVAYTTYYATQTIGDCESEAIGILVEPELGVSDTSGNSITAYPNPVADVLNLSGKQNISSVAIYDISGKLVSAAGYNATEAKVNFRGLTSGTYLVKIVSGDNVQTIKVIKK